MAQVGLATCAPIDVHSVFTAKIVSRPANVSTAAIAITSPANANALPALWGTIVWTVVPATCLVSIARKRVAVKMALLVIRQRALVRAHLAGRV